MDTKQIYTENLYEADRTELRTKVDKILTIAFPLQWIACVFIGYVYEPTSISHFQGNQFERALISAVLGFLIISFPLYRALFRAGSASNGYVMAIGLVMISDLISVQSDGSTESYFHLIASMALIAFYREWRVMLLTAGLFTATRVARSLLIPETLGFSSANVTIELINHLSWLYFTVALLSASCVRRANEMWRVAERTSESTFADARYRAIVEQTDEAIALFEPETFKVLECNEHFIKLIGYGSRYQIEDKDERFRLSKNEKLRRIIGQDQEQNSERGRREIWYTRIDGKRMPIEFSAFVIKVGPDEMISFSARDITNRKETEEELQLAHENLEAKVAIRTRELADANENMASEMRERQIMAEKLQTAKEFTSKIINRIPMPVFVKDEDGRYVIANPAMGILYDTKPDELVGKTDYDFSDLLENSEEIDDDDQKVLNGEEIMIPEQMFTTRNNEIKWLQTHKTLLESSNGKDRYVLGISTDMTHRKVIESQLRHAQKMESIGQLSAGIAHEINTPTQYVGDNIKFVEDAYNEIAALLDRYNLLLEEMEKRDEVHPMVAEIRAAVKKADLEYLKTEVPLAIEQSHEGVSRISKIVCSMRDFAHPGSDEMKAIDLNNAIISTITVAQNKWKYVAEVVTNLDENLPMVPCQISEINQVVLNMIVNASHAIEDVVGESGNSKGTITITTRQAQEEWVEVLIADTGKGISPENRSKIFDPFFTTKEVGKGTGQGLAISHNVVVAKHHGELRVDSVEDSGTTFTIRLPLNHVPKSEKGGTPNA